MMLLYFLFYFFLIKKYGFQRIPPLINNLIVIVSYPFVLELNSFFPRYLELQSFILVFLCTQSIGFYLADCFDIIFIDHVNKYRKTNYIHHHIFSILCLLPIYRYKSIYSYAHFYLEIGNFFVYLTYFFNNNKYVKVLYFIFYPSSRMYVFINWIHYSIFFELEFLTSFSFICICILNIYWIFKKLK